ncbi:MAG: TetR/AcrR family transcriptional regulator, partial [Thermoleophilia bacterium]|nr:TetR/AcrR family transcriptional regulator [Thermoleophilia bacterium]
MSVRSLSMCSVNKIVGDETPVKPRTRTLPPEERRRQIIDAVRRVVAEHGVPNTTVSRVAEAAGVAQGTLYLHFRDRTDMLLAALESIWAEMRGLVEIPGETDQLERLRKAGQKHTELMATEQGSFAVPWVEFIAAPAEMGLRGAVAETQRRAFRVMRDIVELGKAEGRIRADVDADQLAWEWLMFVWAENIACLVGLDEFFEEKRSQPLLELILEKASPDADSAPRPSREPKAP